MSDVRRDRGEGGEASPGDRPDGTAPGVVALLGGPVFVDIRPGHIRATFGGVTGVGPDRASAFRALEEQVKAAPSS